jgi:hypothetical protein
MNRHDRRRIVAIHGVPKSSMGSISVADLKGEGAGLQPSTEQPHDLPMAKYGGPTPSIRVLLIDGPARAIKQIIMKMDPAEFRKVLGARKLSWAKLGEIDERIHIMLAGDPSEQTVDIEHRWFEQEFEVLDEDGNVGPILHGKAAVFGFAPAIEKATSSPVNPIWLQERVRWLDRGAYQRLKDSSERTEQEALEGQPRQIGQAEATGPQDLPALPSD